MIKTKIENYLKKAVKERIEIEVFTPENEQFGHYSTNVALKLAKIRKQNPMEAAEEIKTALSHRIVANFKSDYFEKIEIAAPGFINFWLSGKTLQNEFKQIYKLGDKFGKSRNKIKKTIVIDYCGVNIAKPMSVGHLRSTIIGQALYNIFKFNGYKVIGDNHLGDWGKQFGVLIAAYKERQKKKKLNDFSLEDLMELYVDYTARMKNDSKLEDIAKEETKKLQNGNKENLKIWKKFHSITFKELKRIFNLLDIKFDYQLGESFYNSMLEGVVSEALKKKVAIKSEGAIVIFTDDNKTPFIIQKSDGAYLYSTTDIATIKYRRSKFKADSILYVVGNEQTLHFSQLFSAVKKMGIVKNQELAHIKFGLILGEDMKKLSTRAGKHISLESLLNEAIIRAGKIIEEKNPNLSLKEKNKIAKLVGIGAVKYNDLSQNRQSDIAFNWDKMLNFEGNSGPYLQYTYARLKSILKKANFKKYDSKYSKYLSEKIELDLILKLEEFSSVIEKITANHFPHYLTDYLFELAKTANSFYQLLPVLKAEKGFKEARLALVKAVAGTLKTGLNLLGIEAPEKM